MQKINWKKLRSNIPEEVQIGPNRTFKVEWHLDIGKTKNNRPIYGITTFSPNLIKLRKKQKDKDAVLSFFHEYLHTFHTYKDCNLTESQVSVLESKFEFFRKMFLRLEGKE